MPCDTFKSPEEKLAIVLGGLKEETNIAELCRHHGIRKTVFYTWRDKFLEGSKSALVSNGTPAGAQGGEGQDRCELEGVIGQLSVHIQALRKS